MNDIFEEYLRERDLHINVPKCQNKIDNVTLDVTLEEKQVLNYLKNNGMLTQKQLAELIGKSDRTIKRIMATLEEKELIERINGKRFGYWKVNIQ